MIVSSMGPSHKIISKKLYSFFRSSLDSSLLASKKKAQAEGEETEEDVEEQRVSLVVVTVGSLFLSCKYFI